MATLELWFQRETEELASVWKAPGKDSDWPGPIHLPNLRPITVSGRWGTMISLAYFRSLPLAKEGVCVCVCLEPNHFPEKGGTGPMENKYPLKRDDRFWFIFIY